MPRIKVGASDAGSDDQIRKTRVFEVDQPATKAVKRMGDGALDDETDTRLRRVQCSPKWMRADFLCCSPYLVMLYSIAGGG